MEKSEIEKGSSEEASQLNRNRSFKSKQLVRSQAIRESTSPPRTVSPAVTDDNVKTNNVNNDTNNVISDTVNETITCNDASSHASEDRCSVTEDDCKKRQPVEIQITGGSWDENTWGGRARRRGPPRDLLTYSPRVACVCGACRACPHCRGRRRKRLCQAKQDSGIVCSEDCPDCSDSEQTGGSNSKAGSVDEKDEHTFYCRCPERKEKPKSMSLSRTDSEDKTELSGPELVNFIKETLNKNARDRSTLLKIERELNALVNDTGRCIVRFPVMTSYGRMLVHRCAALFQLSHHLDQTSKNSVLVSKSGTCGGRIPCTSFKAWCTAALPGASPQRHLADNTHAKSILKRDTRSLEEAGSGALSAARSKSLEQREKDYERVRRRIFSTDNCTQDESQWPWLGSGPVKLLTPGDGNRNKLLKVQSLEGPGSNHTRGRGAVSKSHSFGGYGGDDQNRQQPPRLLSRQGDLASSSWRLSPSSSGYRTLSLHSADSVSPSPTGGASPEPSGECAVVWAVTDLAAVPRGALVLHPQTGRPLTNPDGSVYHYEPGNPPPLFNLNTYDAERIDQNNEKRRGRLEKQHSFIDNECDCQPSEESRKCCCECQRHENCRNHTDKGQEEQNPSQKPTSPCKNQEPTNHSQAQESPANHRPYPTTNEKPPKDSTNQRPNYEHQSNYSPKPRPGFENRTYENHHRFESRTFESSQKFEPANQRSEVTNQRNESTNRKEEIQYVGQQQSFQPTFTHEEVAHVTSPPQLQPVQLLQQDMSLQITKTTPLTLPDPNIRPLSLGNMMYQALPQPYQFVNHRVEQPVQAIYQPVEEVKVPASPFRIDPSYPQEFCAACLDPNHQTHQHAAFNMQYQQMEVPQPMMPQYPMTNLALLQQMQSYPYQEPVQWPPLQPMVPVPAAPKMLLHDYSALYPAVYPYNVLYPQMIPQPYPVCQPMFPAVDKQIVAGGQRHSKRNSISGSSRNTPLQTPDDKKVPYEDSNHYQYCQSQQSQRPDELAMAQIQDIQDQVARLNMRGGNEKREWRRRNSGYGILGSHPATNARLPPRPHNDETHLNAEARSILNSIRSLPPKSNSFQERKPEYYNSGRNNQDGYRKRADGPRPHSDPRPYRPAMHTQMSAAGTWCRRSPGPIHPVLNQPRRPFPDNRNPRR